ncbi:unnamed protein product [Lota lota]
MPVAMRKRSWEEHVTHRSGLQYSFDDLDLVCCRSAGHGPGDGSKHGRQVRCASMPECRHHRPTPDGGPRGKVDQNQDEERAQLDGHAEEVNQSSSTARGTHVKVQCCTEGINSHVLSEQQLDSGLVTNSIQCVDENMENKFPVNLNGSPVSHDLTFSESQTKSQHGQLENSAPKLDTILEFNSSESDDNPTPQTQMNNALSLAYAPLDQQSTNMDSKENTTTLQRPQTEASPEVVDDDLTPDGLPGNQASGCYLGEPPAYDGPDGQSKHRGPDTTCSTFEEMEEMQAAQAVATHCGPQLPTPGSHEMRESEDLKDESLQDSSRLDSMVLLLMKLDQLDKEIENALSATSSMDSTPTPRRRHVLDTVRGCAGTGSALGSRSAMSRSMRWQLLQKSISEHLRFSSCRALDALSKTTREGRLAEIEAKEACTWLRAAGFPQYAQLYEDAQFPIDISSVTRDHDFLDRDAIEALCRRLNTLNKCALMRLEITPQRKRSEDSDEDEPCAISGRWTFQRDSKRWSRLDQELEVFSSLTSQEASSQPHDQSCSTSNSTSATMPLSLREGHSSESVLTDLSEQPEVGSIHSGGSVSGAGRARDDKSRAGARLAGPASPAGATRASSVASMCSSSGTGGSGFANEDSTSDGPPPSPLELMGQFTFDMRAGTDRQGSLDRAGGGGGGGAGDGGGGGGGGGGKSTRSRAKSFLKRMESLRLRSASSSSSSSSSSKRKKKLSGGKLDISGPVAREGLDDDKLAHMHCVDIANLNHRNPAQTMTLNRSRGVPYSTQNSNGSTGSTGSSQSEASSGSTVSTPSPVTRARSHSTAAGSTKRGGMYLEGFDPFSLRQQSNHQPPAVDKEQEEEEEEEEERVIFFFLPEGHKPGTFPRALQDGSCNNNNNDDSNANPVVLRGGRQSRRRQRHASSGSAGSEGRLSFYDNVPPCQDDEEEADGRKLEEVLQHVSGMQRYVNAWSEAMAGEEEEEEEEEDEEEEDEEEGDSDSALDSASPCPSSPLQNRLEEHGSDQDSTGNPLGEGEEGMRERRDSGVGASLTRTNRWKLRWPSFQSSHRPSQASAQLQIGCQSVLQMNLLQKLSLLKLTALLERHTPTNKHGFSWAVPKFMKRVKVRDYKDKNVFGVPLQVNVQRSGQPLPQGIQQAMRYLRNHCLDQVGLFRKSGVKSRIQALRQMNEACGADGGGVSYEGQSAYDVADMLKQYFRDLPEPLLTSKLSETFLQIYQYMPKELRLQAVRAAVLLLPDESRDALHTLLCLLSDVTASVGENQMTPTNLAVCLAPSLFHLNTLRRKESSSPRVMNRKPTLGKPDQRDLNENLAATHGLAHMIQECRKLFRIPEEMSRCRDSYVEQALLPRRLEELGGAEGGPGGYRAYLQHSLDALLKDAKDKFKGYDSLSTPEQAELAYKKVHDGSPLRLWKVTMEVPAGPEEVLTRVLREQGRWDEDLVESRVLETLDERTEVYQYVRASMAPHPTTDHLVLRTWVTDLPKGACALVCISVDHEGAPALGVRANVLTSRYFIEPCGSSKSRLTHISRTDCRGRFPEWYNKLYGHLCAAEVVRIRDSFTDMTSRTQEVRV